MSTVESPAAPARPLVWWLVPTAILALGAIGTLWALPRPAGVCPAIYPAPPECFTGGDPSGVIPFLVVIVFLYAAIVTCGVLLAPSRRPLVLGLLTGGIGLVFLIGLAVALNGPRPF